MTSQCTRQTPGKSIDDLNISSEEMIPEAPGLPKPDQGRGRSRERVATSTNADKGRMNPRDPDPPSSPPSSSSESSEGLDKKKIAKMIKKQLSKIGGKSESSQRTKEADRVIVPKFPNPEAYRNWRIRVRDAVTVD